MINNRQAGRRRGRGGGGGQRQNGGNPNAGGNGNRIDNRARGNVNQLYDKYKALARDAQMQGDRVNTEYYLQFADHYFRVLSENRSRFEDQNPNQQRRGRDDQFDEEDGFDEDGFDDAPRPQQQQRDDRERRPERVNAHPAPAPANDAEDVIYAEAAPNLAAPLTDAPAPAEGEGNGRRRGRPRREPRPVTAEAGVEGEAIDADRLPPSLGMSIGTEDEAPKPRRRRRITPTGEPEVTAAE